MWRDDAYLLDILLAAQKVRHYTQGVTREQFQGDDLLQNAVMRWIQVIGEAAWRMSPEFKQDHLEIPRAAMSGMRHHLVHDYFRVDPDRVWEVVEENLPVLIALIQPLVPPDEPSEPNR